MFGRRGTLHLPFRDFSNFCNPSFFRDFSNFGAPNFMSFSKFEALLFTILKSIFPEFLPLRPFFFLFSYYCVLGFSGLFQFLFNFVFLNLFTPFVRSFAHFLFLRHRIMCWPLPRHLQLVTKVLVSRESPLPPCQHWPGRNSPVLRH